MPIRLEGSCRCGAISFSVDSHTPYPYQRCYCSICRKSAGGGGYAINIMGLSDTLKLKGKSALGVWNAPIGGHKGSADRHYCKRCARRSGSAMSNGLNWCTRLLRRSIRSCPRRLRAYICCCAIKRAGSNRRSAPMTTVSTVIPNCRSRTGTKNTGCGSNDSTLRKSKADRRDDRDGARLEDAFAFLAALGYRGFRFEPAAGLVPIAMPGDSDYWFIPAEHPA
jgi:hypothetical protein